jgi:hypothetical protein
MGALRFSRGDRVEQPVVRNGVVLSWRRGQVVKTGARGIRVKLDDGGLMWLAGKGIRKIEEEPETKVTVRSKPAPAPKPAPKPAPAPKPEPKPGPAPKPEPKPGPAPEPDPAVDDLMAEARALAEMQAPLIRKLQRKLMRLGAAKLQLEKDREAALARFAAAEEDIRLDTERVEATLDGFSVARVEAEIAQPRDAERIARYQAHLTTVLSEGGKSWREIRVEILTAHPDTDTAFLYSALMSGRDSGFYAHDGRRNGIWSLA